MDKFKGQLYPIPDAHTDECLVATETDCRQKSSIKPNKEGKLMVRIMKKLKSNVIKHALIIVILLSIFHVGVAYIHSRGSGRADLF